MALGGLTPSACLPQRLALIAEMTLVRKHNLKAPCFSLPRTSDKRIYPARLFSCVLVLKSKCADRKQSPPRIQQYSKLQLACRWVCLKKLVSCRISPS